MDWDIRMDCRGLNRTKGFSMEEQSANCRDISDFCNVKLGWKKKKNTQLQERKYVHSCDTFKKWQTLEDEY